MRLYTHLRLSVVDKTGLRTFFLFHLLSHLFIKRVVTVNEGEERPKSNLEQITEIFFLATFFHTLHKGWSALRRGAITSLIRVSQCLVYVQHPLYYTTAASHYYHFFSHNSTSLSYRSFYSIYNSDYKTKKKRKNV